MSQDHKRTFPFTPDPAELSIRRQRRNAPPTNHTTQVLTTTDNATQFTIIRIIADFLTGLRLVLTLSSALENGRSLTLREYSQLSNLSQEILAIIIASLSSTGVNFFDLTVSVNYEADNFIMMESDAEDPHTHNFPLLSYALRIQDFNFAARLLNTLTPNQESTLSIVNTEDPLGQTLLHLAVGLSNYEISYSLLNLGAEINTLNHVGDSTLAILLFDSNFLQSSSSISIRNLLLENGAEYTLSGLTINTQDLELPDITSESNLNNADNINEFLLANPDLTLNALYALNLIPTAMYEILEFSSNCEDTNTVELSGSDSGYSGGDESDFD